MTMEQMEVEKQLDEIMDNFDWEKVRSVMRHLNWTWRDADEPPSVYRLMKTADELLRSAAASGGTSGTGGFHAENRYGQLRLAFEVASWDYEDFGPTERSV